jgi:hypothetical protein
VLTIPSFIYRPAHAQDANYKMRRYNNSSEAADPALGDGRAYFVRDAPYKAWLSQDLQNAEQVSWDFKRDDSNL